MFEVVFTSFTELNRIFDSYEEATCYRKQYESSDIFSMCIEIKNKEEIEWKRENCCFKV